MLEVPRLCAGCAAAALLAGLASACDAGEEEPTRLRELMERYFDSGRPAAATVEEPPIPVPATPRLQKDFRKDWKAWFHRAVVNRCFPEAPPQPLADFLDRAISAVLVDNDLTSQRQFAEFQKEASRWVEAGQDEPLLLYLLWKAQAQANPDAVRDQKLLKKACEHPAFPAAPPVLRFRLADARYRMEKELNRPAQAAWLRQRFELMTACLNDPQSYLPRDEESLVENCHWMLESKTIGQFEAEFRKWMAGAALTPWSRDALMGEYHITKAWEARGGGWASEVTEEGWKGFKQHLAQARNHLEAAWKRNPQIPFAPSRMITVSMGQCGSGGDSCRTWFDRAIAAQLDYPDAFKNYLWSIRPRWGGSHEQMLAFGRACALTRRFDSRVPGMLFVATGDVEEELDKDWRSLYSDAALVDLLVETARGYLAQAEPADWPALRRSRLVYAAWAARRYDLAAQELQRLGPTFHKDVEWDMSRRELSPVRIMGEIALAQKGLLPDWERIEQSYEAGDLEEAARQMKELEPRLGRETRVELVEQRLRAIQFESALQDGEWVPLKIEPGLPGWEIRKGNWSAEPGDVLTLKGEGSPALALFPGRVGNPFEIRGTCRNPARKDSVGWGIVVGHQRKMDKESYVTCCTWKSKGGMLASLLEQRFVSDFPARPVPAGGEDSSFHITVRGNKVSFRVNGEVIASEVEVRHKVSAKLIEIPPGSRIGFGHHQAPRGEMLRIGNVQVRLLEPAGWANLPPRPSAPRQQSTNAPGMAWSRVASAAP